MGKKVLKYSEEEFVTLLENIVKRVKQEETLEESKKVERPNSRRKISTRRK